MKINHDDSENDMIHEMHHEGPEEKDKCIVCGKEMDRKHKMEGGHVHTGMIEDLKKRFIICIIITVPILLLSPLVQEVLGIGR
jgi:Cu2+-exporting ATPase